ncbi:S1C family serine protease, partial [Actinoalloteichus spitiensis]|uniref:S1C family serine protease n=1 Tax=Actinoalloteichus spitiensis TaxID=252394 RepID=UPI000474E5EC
RPAGARDGLQRQPGRTAPATPPEPVMWADERDAWRDPSAAAVLGPPALETPDDDGGTDTAPASPAARLSAREVLFGQRVKPTALGALFAAALLVGLVGGFLGRITAEGGSVVNRPDVTLAEAGTAVEREPGSLAEVVDRVRPAVVSVDTGDGAGSGVVIHEEGYIVTNEHVVASAADADSPDVDVVFSDGSRAEAALVGRDQRTDLAVLKVNVDNLTVIQMGDSDQLAVGDTVLAIGNPLNLPNTVTSGIISALDRPSRLPAAETSVISAIQTDAAINRGNSGGALVNSSGALVGINTAIREATPGGGSIGIGLANPVNQVRRIAEDLIQHGRVEHPDLGVNPVTRVSGNQYGAEVANVREGGAAERAGVQEGDVITKVDDQPVGGADELLLAVGQHQIGDQIELEIVRGDGVLVIPVTLDSDQNR